VLFSQEETLKSVQYCRTVLYRLLCILVQAYTGLTFGNDFLLSADFEIMRQEERCRLALFLTPLLLSGLRRFRSSLLMYHTRPSAAVQTASRHDTLTHEETLVNKQDPRTFTPKRSIFHIKQSEQEDGRWEKKRGKEKETSREDRNKGDTEAVCDLGRDIARVLQFAHQAWVEVPNANKMRLGVDGPGKTDNILFGAPAHLREAWLLANELLRPISRTIRTSADPAPACDMVEDKQLVSDQGVSSDSEDSQFYSASVASRSSMLQSLPPLRVVPTGRGKVNKGKSRVVKLPVLKSVEGGKGLHSGKVKLEAKERKGKALND
jgi:hypothetical protein